MIKNINTYMYKIIIPLIGAFLFASCGETGETQTQEEKNLPVVKVNTIMPVPFVQEFTVVGTVKPYETATLAAVEGGLIIFLQKDKGDYVRKGETVIRIKKDIEQASYEQAVTQYKLAKSNFDRIKNLYEQNAASEQDYTNAKYNFQLAEDAVEILQARLTNSIVRSPISGVIENKMMSRGEVTGPGTPIVKVVDISRVKISAGIPERYINDVHKSARVKITFDVFPGEEFYGIINFISPTLNTQNRTFEIEAVIKNPGGRIKPEMSANVEITKLSIDDAIVLPQDQIIDFGHEKYVFVLENDIAKRKDITISGRSGNKILIGSGLNPGDKLIIEGFQSLADGDKVKVIN
jgi:membrane fusion protein, multidrug efflux system